MRKNLYLLTFICHLFIVFYAANDHREILVIQEIQQILSHYYAKIGLYWEGRGSYLMTIALISSFILNSCRQFSGKLSSLGSRYQWNGGFRLVKAGLQLLFYAAITYLAIGYLGEKFSAKRMSSISIVILSVQSFIFGMLVNILEDFISAALAWRGRHHY